VGGEVKRNCVGDKPIQRDLVERLAIEDLVCGRVYVRADVVDQPVLGHRVTIARHAREIVKGRRGNPWKDGHSVLQVLRQVNDRGDGHPVVARLTGSLPARRRL
jgi:hypothetical protein